MRRRIRDGKMVYFIRPIGMLGPIKIGNSISPQMRMNSLANWCPFALEIVAAVPGGAALERQFHAKFAHDHERQE